MALVIPIVAMLLLPRRRAADATPAGNQITQQAIDTNVPFRAHVQRTGLCAWHLEFCKYRGLYRQVGLPLLVLGAIVLPGWLLFRLHRRRTQRHTMSARREILLLTAVVYLLCVAALTLTPTRSSRSRTASMAGVELRPNPASLTCSPASLPATPNARTFCVQNAAGNVALFFPLGVLIPLVWAHLRFRRGMQIAIALSLGIELLQYSVRAWGSHRSADVNDVLLNVLGACLGWGVVSLLRLLEARRPVDDARAVPADPGRS